MFYPSIQTRPEKSSLSFIMVVILSCFFTIAQASGTSDDKHSGQLLFQQNCAVCHGSEGTGGVGVPLNMDDFLSTTSNQYLQQTIRLGRPGRVMPAFTSLSDNQVENIIHYIRSWKPEIKAPVYSQESIIADVKKGQAIYDAVCFNCHREKGIEMQKFLPLQ